MKSTMKIATANVVSVGNAPAKINSLTRYKQRLSDGDGLAAASASTSLASPVKYLEDVEAPYLV